MRASTARADDVRALSSRLGNCGCFIRFSAFDLGFVGVHTKRTCVGARLATSQRVTNRYFLSQRGEADEGLF